MTRSNKATKDCLIYSADICIENISAKAYEYVVNSRNAVEWIMAYHSVKTYKDSIITNYPNDWATEHDTPSYILDLLLSVINVSVQTMEIVITFEEGIDEAVEKA